MSDLFDEEPSEEEKDVLLDIMEDGENLPLNEDVNVEEEADRLSKLDYHTKGRKDV